MAGSINDFKSSFVTDLARPSRFDVSIPVPLTLYPFLNTSRKLNFRCETAQLPSRTLATAEQKFGSNPIEKYPYQPQYNDVELTFIVSDDMSEKIFFDSWLEYINPSYTFNFKYKTDYATTVTINQYDVAANKTYSINLIDAYPISVNQLDLEWSNTDYHKLVVVFAYTYWQNNSVQAFGTSLLQTAISQITAGFGGLGQANPIPDISTSIVTPNPPFTPTSAEDGYQIPNPTSAEDGYQLS